MEIKEILKKAIEVLKERNIDEPVAKARILLADLLNVEKEYLIIHDNNTISKDLVESYFKKVEKLCNNIPLQYITQKQEFMGDIFEVNENVLIPRFDTEILVEEALKHAMGSILELCTGSGIIGISIAKRNTGVKVVATDISERALEVAKKNAENHNVDIKFIESNMFENVQGKFDLIVSNPPYIETDTVHKLEEQVKKEPIIALDGGIDGLDFYRIIAENAYKYLNNSGYICLEIGYNQKEAVEKLLKDRYVDIRCVKDLAGKDRVIVCRFHQK